MTIVAVTAKFQVSYRKRQCRAARCAERPVTGFRICTLADGTFIDWHPEVVNQVVLVLSGEIALESSGDRRNERFLSGDVCLAEDRTGIGHIDRVRGLTALCLLVMEDLDLW